MGGRRGPPPTPTAVLALRGSRRANGRDGEPVPASGSPTCPRWLSPEAKQVWRQVVRELGAMGTLARSDALAIARYCVMFVQWRQAVQAVDENGLTFDGTNKRGDPYIGPRPEIKIAATLATGLLRLEQEFGLTPASRARIRVDIPEPVQVKTSPALQIRVV